MTDYNLNRSKRKTVALYIRDGAVEVRAPLRMAKRDIDTFVASKERWITEKLAQSNVQKAQRDSFHLDYGNLILYRGKPYPIVAKTTNGPACFDGASFLIPPYRLTAHIMDACIQVYRAEARSVIKPKAYTFAERMSVSFASVKITGAQKQWGSCSARKRLNFSWRLMMADDDLIDYVIVHELAHITEMNHSPRFWAIVEKMLPDYRERKIRLRELQKRLSCEDWEVWLCDAL